jgi:hypothetical protein
MFQDLKENNGQPRQVRIAKLFSLNERKMKNFHNIQTEGIKEYQTSTTENT